MIAMRSNHDHAYTLLGQFKYFCRQLYALRTQSPGAEPVINVESEDSLSAIAIINDMRLLQFRLCLCYLLTHEG